VFTFDTQALVDHLADAGEHPLADLVLFGRVGLHRRRPHQPEWPQLRLPLVDDMRVLDRPGPRHVVLVVNDDLLLDRVLDPVGGAVPEVDRDVVARPVAERPPLDVDAGTLDRVVGGVERVHAL
jgi:hypothetical protein